MNDARGINSVEFSQGGFQALSSTAAVIDNLRIVPEPATCLMLVTGGVALLHLRRRQSSP